MSIDKFVATYNKQPHLIGVFRTPKMSTVRGVLKEFEATGVCTSPDGVCADIVAKWLLYTGKPLALYYHQTFKVWVVRSTTDAEIEAKARE